MPHLLQIIFVFLLIHKRFLHQSLCAFCLRGRPKPSAVSVAQQIYDFLTGKPCISGQKHHNGKDNDSSPSSLSDDRKHRSKKRHKDRRHNNKHARYDGRQSSLFWAVRAVWLR